MVSVLDYGASGLGLSPGRGRCVVFLSKTLYYYSASLHLARCINGYRRIVGENLTNCGGVTYNGLASRPGEVEILLGRDKLWQLWASWL